MDSLFLVDASCAGVIETKILLLHLRIADEGLESTEVAEFRKILNESVSKLAQRKAPLDRRSSGAFRKI